MRWVVMWSTIAVFFMLIGCANKGLTKEQSSKIVWKSPTMKYADMGFISRSNNLVKAEIYGSGSALFRLKISNSKVCFGTLQCMNKQAFNNKMLCVHYPKDILENIFRGEPIFNGLNIYKTQQGFTQELSASKAYNIHYSVTKSEIRFEDSLNNILIKIKSFD